MKTVRCKFRCTQAPAERVADRGETFTATFEPVYSGSQENAEFFKYTPGVSLRLDVMAKQHFEAGKEYYLDITLADAPVVDTPLC